MSEYKTWCCSSPFSFFRKQRMQFYMCHGYTKFMIRPTEGFQVNMGFLQNPPKQHFGDRKSKLTVGERSPEHQLGGDNRTVSLPHLSFRIPG